MRPGVLLFPVRRRAGSDPACVCCCEPWVGGLRPAHTPDAAGSVRRPATVCAGVYQFESPLLRLLNDEDYRLLVRGDQHVYLDSRDDGTVPPATVWVHRFYDYAATTFGTSITRRPEDFDLEKAAERLYAFVQLPQDWRRQGVSGRAFNGRAHRPLHDPEVLPRGRCER
jgi:hypothetical protein